jgi:GNAT superfamily N-acetyltransferase
MFQTRVDDGRERMFRVKRMQEEHLRQVNSVFSKSFSNARIEEGLKRHRVSPCRPEFLRMYLDRSGEGAVVVTDRGRVTGFNFNHMFGSTGWMGPVAVLPGCQGTGVGKALVGAGVDYLKRGDAKIIGLETMPRNFRNIGFYLRLGFEFGPLCVDMVSPAHSGPKAEGRGSGEVLYFSERRESSRNAILAGVAEISETISPGLDYRKELLLNLDHEFGETAVLMDGDVVAGFAVCHLEPYGQFEERRELKVIVLALRPEGPNSEGAPSGSPPYFPG